MLRTAEFRLGVGQHRARIAQIHRVVRGAAHIAVVAGLILRAAPRAGAAHLPIGEEEAPLRVVELLYLARERVAAFGETGVDQARIVFVLRRVGGVVVVVADVEALEVRLVLAPQPLDQRLGGHALAFGEQHGRRAVRVVGTHVDALVAHHALEPHPDVRLDVLEQVSEMDRAVGVRQRTGDKDSTHDGASARRIRFGRAL